MVTRRCAAGRRFLIVTLFVVFWVEGLASAQPATDIGPNVCATITLLEGASTLARPPLAQRSLVVGETLYAGSILHTGATSRVELTFADRSVVRLDANTSIELGVGTRGAEKQAERFQVKLLKGEIWVTLLDQPEGRNSPQILMAGALLVGDKSVFRAILFQNGAAEMKAYAGYTTASGPFVFVKEGARFLLQPAGVDDETQITEPWRYRIEPYRKMIIQATGKETKPFRFTARADLSTWVRWNQLRDGEIK